MDATSTTGSKKQRLSLKGRLMHYVMTLLRLTNRPTIKLYRGFGNPSKLIIFGHVLRRSALPRKHYRDNSLVNLLAVIRLFLVKPQPHAFVRIRCVGHVVETHTEADGFFRVEIILDEPLLPGQYPVRAEFVSQTLTPETILGTGTGQVYVPSPTTYGCISDIDDTFLISHSSTITKRLLVLLTENAHSREPFDGVVSHYQLLAEANSGPHDRNPFFYVSSSEWNLYDYILEFSEKNGLPEGIYLLNQIKRLSQVLQTGKSKHLTKFDRIASILETYSDMQFILLGDDSQQDPTIYETVVRHYPKQVRCVYIRQVNQTNRSATQDLVDKIQQAGVTCCYFKNSTIAQEHSLRVGLVAS
jgi:phosphatidate phosphatase APP1